MGSVAKLSKHCTFEIPMTTTLHKKLNNLPSSPGVYLMKDAKGHILYVGKGKDLRKRVLSYFREKQQSSPKFPGSPIWRSS